MLTSSKSLLMTCAMLVAIVHCGGTTNSSTPNENVAPTDRVQADASATPVADGDTSLDASADAPVSTAACNTLVNDGVTLNAIEMVASSAPAPTGGGFVDGTYHLTSITLYAGPNTKAGTIPLTIKGTLSVHGKVVDQVLDGTKNGGDVIADRTTEAFETSGSSVTYTKSCPAVSTRTATYSASATSLTLFLLNEVGQTVGYTYAL